MLLGKSLDEIQISTLQNVTGAVLKGSDHVFLLLDKRMKSAFKHAVKFVFNKNGDLSQAPVSMKTGIQSDLRSDDKKVNSVKIQFKVEVGKEVQKLGFKLVEDALLDAMYDAYKVISHCIKVYGDVLLYPMYMKISTS